MKREPHHFVSATRDHILNVESVLFQAVAIPVLKALKVFFNQHRVTWMDGQRIFGVEHESLNALTSPTRDKAGKQTRVTSLARFAKIIHIATLAGFTVKVSVMTDEGQEVSTETYLPNRAEREARFKEFVETLQQGDFFAVDSHRERAINIPRVQMKYYYSRLRYQTMPAEQRFVVVGIIEAVVEAAKQSRLTPPELIADLYGLGLGEGVTNGLI